MTCFECGGTLDESKPYRYMDVLHEDSADEDDKMRVYANESCIVGFPNEKNWEYAIRVTPDDKGVM